MLDFVNLYIKPKGILFDGRNQSNGVKSIALRSEDDRYRQADVFFYSSMSGVKPEFHNNCWKHKNYEII